MIYSSFFAKHEGSARYGGTAATTQQLDEACEVLLQRRWAENSRIVWTCYPSVNPFLPNTIGTLFCAIGKPTAIIGYLCSGLTLFSSPGCTESNCTDDQ